MKLSDIIKQPIEFECFACKKKLFRFESFRYREYCECCLIKVVAKAMTNLRKKEDGRK